MRVLQVGKYYYPENGGIETHLRTLAAGLRAHAEVEILVAATSGQAGVECVDGIQVERLPVAMSPFGAPICPRLITRLRDSNADLVHVHLPNPWAAMAYLSSGCRRPLVVSYHSDVVRQSFIEPAFRPILLRFLERASAILCASTNLIRHSRTLRSFHDRCVVIPYGVEQKELSEAEKTEAASIKEKFRKPIVLAVGRLVYYKGFEHLIRTMQHVEDAVLVIAGSGRRKNELLRLASDIGVAGKLTILDQVENLRPLYQAAEIFVLPSIARSEAFGIVQVEAMSAGKPVINTQLLSGVPGVSQHGLTGLTVAPADSTALAGAINKLLADSELRQRFGNAAKVRARNEFNIAAMVSRTLDEYRRILPQQARAAAAS